VRTVLCGIAGAVLVTLDGRVLLVVQPTLQRDLHATLGQVQWTSTAYLIAVASLLVFAGRLGDRYGHGRLFAVGSLGFAAASAGIGEVIAWRVAQGVFGALVATPETALGVALVAGCAFVLHERRTANPLVRLPLGGTAPALGLLLVASRHRRRDHPRHRPATGDDAGDPGRRRADRGSPRRPTPARDGPRMSASWGIGAVDNPMRCRIC
jgi:MFS family permease